MAEERKRWEFDADTYHEIRRAKEHAELRNKDEDDSIRPEEDECDSEVFSPE